MTAPIPMTPSSHSRARTLKAMQSSNDSRKPFAALAIVLCGLAWSGAAAAQSVDTGTLVVPTPVYPVTDENGVILSSNALNIPGPSVAIGDPKQGGLEVRPNIVGPDPIAIMYFCMYTTCDRTGFTNTSSNLGASLVVGGRWGNIPITATPMIINAPSGVARFYVTSSAPTSPIEYSPHINRTLTYSTGAPLVTQRDTGERMTFQDSDGTKYVFLYITAPNQTLGPSFSFPIQSIVRPNGDVTTFTYNSALVGGDANGNMTTDYNLSSISNNRGFMIKFENGSYTMGSPPVAGSDSVVAVNLAVDSCSVSAATCSFAHSWPKLTGGRYSGYATGWPRNYTDATGATTTVNVAWPPTPYPARPAPATLTATMTRPNGRVQTAAYDYSYYVPHPVSMVYNCPMAPAQISIYTPGWNPLWTFPCPFAPVTSLSDGVSTWTYKLDLSFAPVSGSPGNYYVSSVTSTRTDQNGGTRVVTALPSGQVTSSKDELNRITTMDVQPMFDPNEGRINKITYPLGNSKSYAYDPRGNVTSETEAPVPGSPLANRVTSYAYPSSCTNWNICNRPTSKTDPKNNVTSYSWDPVSGQPLSVTMPPDANGISPVKRYSYTQMYAWISNGAGGYQQSGPPIWMLTQMRTCRTTATVGSACAGGASDEVVTDYYYGPQSGPNNLLLRGMSVTANGVRLNTCYGYDLFGRKISETQPNANITVCP